MAGGALSLALATSVLAGCSAGADGGATPAPTSSIPSAHEQNVAQLLAEYPDADVPTVQPIRVVTLLEWPEVFAQCVTDEGFPASAAADGGVDFEAIPAEQADASALATFVCRERYPVDPSEFEDPDLSGLYDYYTQELVPCLEAEGYEIPSPPSEQTFIDSYWTAAWIPYNFVEVTSDEEWTRLNAACPQHP
jgi:hypothetical protein